MTEEAQKQGDIAYDKDVVSKFISASGIICDKPCWVHMIMGAGFAEVDNGFCIHDDWSTATPAVCGLVVGQYDSIPVYFDPPMRFNKGLYISFSPKGHSFFARFKPDH